MMEPKKVTGEIRKDQESSKFSLGIGFGKVVNEEVRKKNNTNQTKPPSLTE